MPDQQKRETPTKSRRPITSTNTSKPARKFVQQNKCPDTKPHHHHTGSNKAQHQTKLALTIGTLLSSQRTDAHPSRPFNRLGGNLRNITRPGPQCQPARPDPAWLVTDGRRRAVPWRRPLGNATPGPCGPRSNWMQGYVTGFRHVKPPPGQGRRHRPLGPDGHREDSSPAAGSRMAIGRRRTSQLPAVRSSGLTRWVSHSAGRTPVGRRRRAGTSSPTPGPPRGCRRWSGRPAPTRR